VDNALLFGSIGLFVLLAITMYLSRKIDWHGMDQKTNAE
jgi:inner membrane protein